jgi:hypothetical protein
MTSPLLPRLSPNEIDDPKDLHSCVHVCEATVLLQFHLADALDVLNCVILVDWRGVRRLK